MKTRLLFKSTFNHLTYIMIFLLGTLSVKAQCPTVTPPPVICDASGFTFADLDAFATDQGGGIVWYDAAVGGNAFNGNELVQEGTYYADDSTGACGPRASVVVTFQVSPTGETLEEIYCDNENATVQSFIDDELSGFIPAGGNVLLYVDFDLTTLANASDVLGLGLTQFFVVFVDSGGCESQIEVGSTAVFAAPSAPTPPDPQSFCDRDNPTVGDLDPGTMSTVNWFNNIDGMGNPIPPALALSTPLADGNTYYVQVLSISCDSDPVGVTVSISNGDEPGLPAMLDYCSASIPPADFNLFDELGGTPDVSGSWSGPLATSNGHLGTVNISTLTTPDTYVFTYTIPANGDCAEVSTNITIEIYESFTSGTPSADNPATFCVSGLPASFDLTTLLDNEDPNGLWTQGTTSADPVVTSPIDLTAFTMGTYDFTYTQNVAPNVCPEVSTTVQVIILDNPVAGVAVATSFCENDLVGNSPFNLLDALDGTQSSNSGVWTNTMGGTVTSPIDITTFTSVDSPYLFTYTLDNGTCSDSVDISIVIEEAPNAGTVNDNPEFCISDISAGQTIDLFDYLDDEDQPGIWSDNTPSGQLAGSILTIDGLAANTYTFTYDVDAIGACDDPNMPMVSVVILQSPNVGVAINASFCENELAADSPFDLFDALDGTQDNNAGVWTDAMGATVTNPIDITVFTTVDSPYLFNYTIDNGSCSDTEQVSIEIKEAPSAGTLNSTPSGFCILDITPGQTINLFDYLDDEDPIGVWSDNEASGQLTGSILTIDGLPAMTYTFTYDVTDINMCDDPNMPVVSITISDASAPTAPPLQVFCDAATVNDLTASGGGIQWYDNATGGTALPITTALVDGGTYYAAQTLAGCESITRTEVTVTIVPMPNSGGLATTPVSGCNVSDTVDLNLGLDGAQDASGTWYEGVDNTGPVVVSPGAYDITGLAAGDYEFTYVVVAPPCMDAQTTITITIDGPLDPGTNGAIDICNLNDGTTYDLFGELGGTPDPGGMWVPALTSGTGVFDPAVDPDGTYTYVLNNSCGNITSEVVVFVANEPNAGEDNTLSLCVEDISAPSNMLDLLTVLDGTPDTTGSFSNDDGAGGFSGNMLDLLLVTPGTYNFTYTVMAIAPCTGTDDAIATVIVADTPPVTIVDANPAFCAADNATVSDLDSSVSGTSTIIWYAEDADTTPLATSDALVDGEDYFAVQLGANSCESSVRIQVDVTINDTAAPTLIDANIELCISDGPTIEELSENITEYNASASNVVWYDAETGGTVLGPSTLLEIGNTYYAVLIDTTTNCESNDRLSFTPDLTSCGVLPIPDGFSPNGDGVNDTFDIDNLVLLHPNFDIEIFNRFGSIVYKGDAGTPRFDGTANQSTLLGSGDLPVGVYYYIFNFNDGINEPKQGRLYLSR